MQTNYLKTYMWPAIIVASISFLVNFLISDSGIISSLVWTAISTAAAIGALFLWRVCRVSRALDWIARHSPLRRVPKTIAVVIIALILFATFAIVSVIVLFKIDQPPIEPYVSYSDFVDKAEANELGEYVTLQQKKQLFSIRVIAWFVDRADGQKKWSYFENAPPNIPPHSPESWLNIRGYNVGLEDSFAWGSVLMQSFQGVVMSVPFFFFLWLIGGGGLKNMGEELSTLRASRDLTGKKVTYKDVAGIDPAVKSLAPYLNFLRNPKQFVKLLAKMPRGVLIHGLPGVGKTLIARAFAGEADIPVYMLSGSDFHFMLVGVGAARADKLFEHAIRNAPSIVVIDEIDSAAPKRGGSDLSGGKERDSLTNKLLSILDRIEKEDIPVIVFGITNHLELLDDALLRDGRFDTKIHIQLPEEKGRRAILDVHLVLPDPSLVADDVDFDEIIRISRNWPGSRLANLANRARIEAAIRGDTEIRNEDIVTAFNFIHFGPETDTELSKEDLRRIAYHESGHAITSLILPGADPAEYVTLKTHGGTLGHALPVPEREYHFESKTRILSRVKMFLAGHAVEVELYGESSTTTKQDIENATIFIRNMIDAGMDEEIGPISIGIIQQSRGGLANVGVLVDRVEGRVQEILKECSTEVEEFFKDSKGRKILDEVTDRLLEEKTLKRAQLEEIIPDEFLEKRTVTVNI